MISRGTTRPMSRDKADTLLLLFSCTLVLLPHAGHLPLWVSPVCAILLLWRGWTTFHGNRLPVRWLLLPIAGAAMAGVLATYKTLLGREAGVTMLCLLLALKLLEMHARRDLFVVLFLSFFLTLTNFFYSQSMSTAALTIVAVIAILTTQLSFQYTGTVPPLKQRLKLGTMILGLAAPLTLVLFLLFPRIQGPLWGLPGDAHGGHTGLSNSMSPGNISKLALSDDIAFRVKFAGTLPAKHDLYWRGIVLNDYDGRTWTQSKFHPRFRHRIEVSFRGAPRRYEVTLEPHGQRWLYVLDMPSILPTLEQNPAGISDDMEVTAVHPVTERVRYTAVSHLDYALQANDGQTAIQESLRLPAGLNPQTTALAQRLRQQAKRPADVIEAVLRMFREQEFRYTLEPPPLGHDEIDDFLFHTRAGFCEHYSGAFVVLMRAAGIPARVVTGYQGGEMNTADGYLAVRQSDAHAWAEVWLERSGWVRIDPTAAVAPNRVEQNLGSVLPRRMLGGLITIDASDQPWLGTLRNWRQRWEAVGNAWNQWVLNYTPEKQRDFVQSLGFNHVDWRVLTALMMSAAILVSAVVLFPLLRNRQRLDPVEAVYRKLCRRLARAGLPRAPYEGPRAYGQRITNAATLNAHQKRAAARFLLLYESLRYGNGRGKPPGALSQLKNLLSECR
jgi:transglutaminase-like putative cysteine protease